MDETALKFLRGAGEMGDRIQGHDWSDNPLGNPAEWPQSLKTAVSLILNSQHPMWIGWGPQMSFLYNDAYLHVLGLAKHPWALGRPAEEVWAEIWDVCQPLTEKVFNHGESSFQDSVRLFMNRGEFLEETYYSFSYSPIRDKSGSVGGLFCPSTDVTPKVVGARRLKTLSELSSRALLQKTIQEACAAVEATLARNPDDIPFALLYLAEGNQANLRASVGVPPDNLSISPESIPLDTREGNVWPLVDALEFGEHQRVRVPGRGEVPRDAAGQPVLEALVVPVVSHVDEKHHGVLVAGLSPFRPFDAAYRTFLELVAITVGMAIENARAAEAERKRADALAELDRAKTAFFSNVSHEFRTPLTLLLGPLETVLTRPGLGAEERSHLETVHRNSLRLLRLVNSLLDFSRIEAGRTNARYAPVDLHTLTSDLASNFRSTMEAGGLYFHVNCPPLSQPAYVDRDMWEKITFNLLSNSFKFTLRGGVTVHLEEHPGEFILSVADTGVGIPEADLPHIFERFHRIENSQGRTYEGTGIGLALVQELVRMHGGSTGVASELGKGSVFTVRIPAGRDHLPAENVAADSGAPVHRAEAFLAEAQRWMPSGSPEQLENLNPDKRPGELPRVLLAEDNADMQDYIRRLLQDHVRITAVNNGREALQLALQDPPDLVLSDVMMPRMDGFQLLQQLRENPATPTIPIILLSARAGEEARIEGVSAGADDYLVKPFSAGELLAKITGHLKLASARRDILSQRDLAAQSSRLLTAIVDSSEDAIISKSLEGIITSWNQGAQNLFGYTAEEAIGQTVATLLIPEDRQDEETRILTRLRNGERVEHFETVRRRRDGRLVDVSLTISPIKDEEGSIIGASKISRDITERKRAEARFHQLAEMGPQIVWLSDPQGGLEFVNQRWIDYSGLDLEATRARGAILTHPDDAISEHFHKAIRAGEPFEREGRLRRKDGEFRWFLMRSVPVRDEHGEIQRWIGTSTDIHDVKQLQLELRRANQDLEQFAYSASHDLREPLRTVTIFSELLAQRYGATQEPEAAEFLATVRRGAARMEMLVRDLLAYTHATTAELPQEPVDADAALRAAMTGLAGAIAETAANITWDSLPTVQIHPIQLQQVFQNLVGNAVKYHKPNVRPSVHVAARMENQTWIFSVRDNGIGIEKKYAERIFGLFKRLHTNDEYSGTGIGLALCQRIVERHHGRIWVESEIGLGSTFFFTIPA